VSVNDVRELDGTAVCLLLKNRKDPNRVSSSDILRSSTLVIHILWRTRRVNDDSFFRLVVSDQVRVIIARPLPYNSTLASFWSVHSGTHTHRD
jgi:hypothetical protein